ncbi:hypothetical protein [Maricaulis maris]|uniref:Uncharacterized protein n=1 Tax=Maricaulis maris TaxID=74318 RepID=A0A495D291_9PROT|nr:hypothetical protein [Maricaulis maris]RKQ95662.1 hypothetical protein C7435_2768 [Maricaulis maris]
MTNDRISRILLQVLTRVVGYVLIAAGAVLAVSPVPLGAVLVAVGMAILIPTDARFRTFLRGRRKRWHWLDKALNRLGHHAPSPYDRYLRR